MLAARSTLWLALPVLVAIGCVGPDRRENPAPPITVEASVRYVEATTSTDESTPASASLPAPFGLAFVVTLAPTSTPSNPTDPISAVPIDVLENNGAMWTPVTSISRTIADPERSPTVLAVPTLTEGAALLTDDSGGTLAPTSLPPTAGLNVVVSRVHRSTVTFTISRTTDRRPPTAIDRVDVHVRGVDDGQYQMSFDVRARDGQVERVQLLDPRPNDAAALLWLPIGDGALWIEWRPTGASDDFDLAASASAATESAIIPDTTTDRTDAEPTPPAWEALRWSETRRRTFVQLAREHGATLGIEVGLLADAVTIGTLAEQLATALSGEAPDVGLAIERSTLNHLAARLDQLSPALESCLIDRCGAAARHADSLTDIATRASSLTDLERRLIAENRIFLRDADASDRVRAFDWLAQRGQAPPGFDPMASSEARRAALRAVREAADSVDSPLAPGSGS